MAKSKIVIFISFLFLTFNSGNTYEIEELINILNTKNQNESVFFYDQKINELDIKNSYSSFIQLFHIQIKLLIQQQKPQLQLL